MERALESLSVQHEATQLVQSEVEEVQRCYALGSDPTQQAILFLPCAKGSCGLTLVFAMSFWAAARDGASSNPRDVW